MTCNAQSFFNNNTDNITTQQNATSAPAPAMSAQEYKNMVKSLGKQNQDELTRSVKEQFSKATPPPPTMPIQTETPETSSSATVNTTTTTPSPPPVTTTPSVPPTTVAPPPPPPQPQPVPTTTEAPPLQSMPTAAPTMPAPRAPQNQPYTGFGTPANTKTDQGASPAPEKSTGWNIQY
jgi:hypothetical protein